MKTSNIQSLLSAALCAVAFSASAQSFGEVANATLDALQEASAQSKAPTDIKDIFAKAKKAEEADNKLNLCGFYTGMSVTDAQTLAAHYALKGDEWHVWGEPVREIVFSLQGVRRVTKGGNTFDELAQAVANRVGSLKQDWETKVYSLKTIDGIVVKMSESAGFSMFDTDLNAAAIAAKRKAEEEYKKAALSFKTEAKTITISSNIEIALQSVPGNLWFGKTEVTQAQWEAVTGENPSHFKGANKPVENVSWNDCQLFLKKLNAMPAVRESGLTFRLPTDVEWKAACRAGATGDYCRLADGTEIERRTLKEIAWFIANSDGKTHPVGKRKPNAFGLYDMLGNVAEWVSTATERTPPAETEPSYCGNSWVSEPFSCTSDNSGSSHQPKRYIGFRLCADGKED